MSALRNALLDWNVNRVTRVLVVGLAVYVSMRATEGFLTGLGLTIVLAVVLDVPWWVVARTSDQ